MRRPATLPLAAIITSFLLLFPVLSAAQDYKIAFVSMTYGATGIYVANADGSHARRLTDDPLALLIDGAWSPDAKRLMFSAVRKGGLQLSPRGLVWPEGDEQLLTKYNLPFHFPLYVMDADGAGQKRLLGVPAVPGARWSPDGKRILFTSAYEDPHRNDPGVRKGTQTVSSALYVVEVATGATRRITEVASTPLDANASWSPDGLRVLFVCGQQTREICVIGVSDAQPQKLTARGGVNVRPAWSPDGQRIAFVAAPRGPADDTGGVYLMDADGTNQRRISKLRTSSVSWSPDGKRILIPVSGAAWVVNVEANSATRLALGSGRVLDQVFSPDGRKVIFRSNEGGKEKIYAINLDGTDRRALGDAAVQPSLFAVSPLSSH